MVAGMVAFTVLDSTHEKGNIKMSYNKIKCFIIPFILLLFSACLDNPSDSESTYGAFRIQLFPEDTGAGDPAYSRIWGTMYDGPSPPNIIFKEVMSSGNCKLMQAISPTCACGLGYKCVSEGSCMAEPKSINVNRVTITGLKVNKTLTPIVMDPPKSNYYQMVNNMTLDYPPCTEGDTITLTAAGSDNAGAFKLKVRGITPLEVLNNEILAEDGKPITLQWKPPTIPDVSTISVRINISYHGGTKGEIQCECPDNGSLTIPGAMLDQLKSYGIAGYPIVEITRRSIGYGEKTKAQVIVECTVTKLLTIPGVVSCNQNGDCPNQHCVDRRCQ
jgi:hypothetical protein